MRIKISLEEIEKENVLLRSAVKMWEDIAEIGTHERIISQLFLEAKKRGYESVDPSKACDFLFSELDKCRAEAEMLRFDLQKIKEQNLLLHSDIRRMITKRL